MNKTVIKDKLFSVQIVLGFAIIFFIALGELSNISWMLLVYPVVGLLVIIGGIAGVKELL